MRGGGLKSSHVTDIVDLSCKFEDLRLIWLTLMKDSTWLWLGIHNLRLDLDLTQMTWKSWLFCLSFFCTYWALSCCMTQCMWLFWPPSWLKPVCVSDIASSVCTKPLFKCRHALCALTTQHDTVPAHIRCNSLVFLCTSAQSCFTLRCCDCVSPAVSQFERRRGPYVQRRCLRDVECVL